VGGRNTHWACSSPAQFRLLEVALPVSTGIVPAETIVPVRGVWVSHLQHRGLAGVEPGHYRDSGSDGECMLYANTADAGAVAPARPAQRCFRAVMASPRPTKASRPVPSAVGRDTPPLEGTRRQSCGAGAGADPQGTAPTRTVPYVWRHTGLPMPNAYPR